MFLPRPLPVYVTDAPIAELRPPELFTICIVRLWVLHYRDPEAVPMDWRAGFAHMHIDQEGETGFDMLFALIASSAIRSLDIRCKRCPRLGEDEGWLLQLVRLLQDDRLAEGAAILADWLPPAAVRRALGPAQAFALGLATRGLCMPPRPVATVSPHPMPAHPHACASNLIH